MVKDYHHHIILNQWLYYHHIMKNINFHINKNQSNISHKIQNYIVNNFMDIKICINHCKVVIFNLKMMNNHILLIQWSYHLHIYFHILIFNHSNTIHFYIDNINHKNKLHILFNILIQNIVYHFIFLLNPYNL